MRPSVFKSLLVIVFLVMVGCRAFAPKLDDVSTTSLTGTIEGDQLRNGCWVVEPKPAYKIIVDSGDVQISVRCIRVGLNSEAYYLAELDVPIEAGHAYVLKFKKGETYKMGEVTVRDRSTGDIVARAIAFWKGSKGF